MVSYHHCLLLISRPHMHNTTKRIAPIQHYPQMKTPLHYHSILQKLLTYCYNWSSIHCFHNYNFMFLLYCLSLEDYLGVTMTISTCAVVDCRCSLSPLTNVCILLFTTTSLSSLTSLFNGHFMLLPFWGIFIHCLWQVCEKLIFSSLTHCIVYATIGVLMSSLWLSLSTFQLSRNHIP